MLMEINKKNILQDKERTSGIVEQFWRRVETSTVACCVLHCSIVRTFVVVFLISQSEPAVTSLPYTHTQTHTHTDTHPQTQTVTVTLLADSANER